MLWIHIGMPKTGTTALQAWLHAHPDFLGQHGIRYLVAGRYPGTGRARLVDVPDYMNIGSTFARIREQVTQAAILPRRYPRKEMAGHNIITDFLALSGVPPDEVPLPERAANRSLSRVASEALGLFDARAGYDKKARRRLGRGLDHLAWVRARGMSLQQPPGPRLTSSTAFPETCHAGSP